MAQTSHQVFRAIAASAVVLAGCGGGGEPGSVAPPPARAGQVWEVQASEDRADVPGSIVAFVNGVHVMVVDGDRVYAGMTTLDDQEWSGRRQDDHLPERSDGGHGAVGAGRGDAVLERRASPGSRAAGRVGGRHDDHRAAGRDALVLCSRAACVALGAVGRIRSRVGRDDVPQGVRRAARHAGAWPRRVRRRCVPAASIVPT